MDERLAPAPEVLANPSAHPLTRTLFAGYLRDIVARLSQDPDVTLALFELRLAAARRPELAERIGRWLRNGFEADLQFNSAAGFPGGTAEIALFRYAIDGLMLDRLTTSIDEATPTNDVVQSLVDGLLPKIPDNRSTSP